MARRRRRYNFKFEKNTTTRRAESDIWPSTMHTHRWEKKKRREEEERKEKRDSDSLAQLCQVCGSWLFNDARQQNVIALKKKRERKKKKEEWEKRPRTDRWSSPVRARTGSVCCRRASKKVLNPVDPRDSRLLLFLFLSLVPAFSDHSRVSLFYFSKMKCYSSDWVVVTS